MTELQNLFESFCSTHRAEMIAPFSDEGIVYATNGHIMIYGPESAIDFKVQPAGYTTPNAKSVIKAFSTYKVLNVKIEEFEQFKTKAQIKECEKCGGHGNILYSKYGKISSSECKYCSGHGFFEIDNAPKHISIYHYTKLDKAYIATHYFYRLFEVQKVVGGEIVFVHGNNPNEGYLFKIGDFVVLIMTTMFDEFKSYNEGIFDITERFEPQYCKDCKNKVIANLEQHLKCKDCVFIGNQQSNFEAKQ